MKSIFISSTFVDMQKERDLIRDKIHPKLDAFARGNGEIIRIEDLRWGIDTSEDSSIKNILNTCFDTILESNPLMLALIGDRYGTLVDIESIYSSMVNRTDSISDISPGSITELELRYALTLNPEQIPSLFFFRNLELPDYVEQENPSIWNIYRESDENALLRTQKLKQIIKEKYPDRVFEYTIKWDPEEKAFTGWDEFCDLVESKTREVLADYFGYSESNNLSEYDLAKNNFIYNFQQDALPIDDSYEFTSNNRQLKELMGLRWYERTRGYWIQSDDHFESDVLMASIACYWLQNRENVILYDCGISRKTFDFYYLVKYICWEIACRLGKSDEFWSLHNEVFQSYLDDGSDCDELLNEWLDLYETEGREHLVIVVRNYHLVDYDDVQYWYPANDKPGKIHWVFNSAERIFWDGESFYFNKQIINHDNGFFDTKFVIDSYMKRNHKQLASSVRDTIIEKVANKPLSYLMILLDRLAGMGEKDYDIIRSYGRDGAAINKYQSQVICSAENTRTNIIISIINSLCEEIDARYVFNVISIAAAVPYPISITYLVHLLESHQIDCNSQYYNHLKIRLASVLRDNIEDALYIKDQDFKKFWKVSRIEEINYWDDVLKAESIPYHGEGIKERYDSHYYRDELTRKTEPTGENSFLYPLAGENTTKYYTKRLALCQDQVNKAVSEEMQIEAALHFCYLELNATRELLRYGIEFGEQTFPIVQEYMRCIANLCKDNNGNFQHIISDLLDYHQECRELNSKEREDLVQSVLDAIRQTETGFLS